MASTIIGFQFQCGAIEGFQYLLSILLNRKFQFQCGAIEGLELDLLLDVADRFQFQCGAIEGRLQNRGNLVHHFISIPVWCD